MDQATDDRAPVECFSHDAVNVPCRCIKHLKHLVLCSKHITSELIKYKIIYYSNLIRIKLLFLFAGYPANLIPKILL